jgi:hypothetical protein
MGHTVVDECKKSHDGSEKLCHSASAAGPRKDEEATMHALRACN